MLHRPIARARERMVLGQVHPLLEVDEHVRVWSHVQAPDGAKVGLLSLTTHRCLVHWSARPEPTAVVRWSELTAWDLAPRDRDATVLSLRSGPDHISVRLPLSTPARARRATEVVEHVARHAPDEAAVSGERTMQHLGALPRGWRGHARRIGVTLLGLLVVLVSIAFASPFVPGPGALTFLAGLAILAKEYDWARDLHHGTKRTFERFWAWLQARREQRRRRRAEVHPLREARRSRPATGDPAAASGAVDLVEPEREQA